MSETKKLRLSKEEKKKLLQAARYTIEQMLSGKPNPDFPDLSAPVFGEKLGLFVTLTIKGDLRGCIGNIEGTNPIRESIKDMAIQAAFHDPRFRSLRKEEYPEISIEISILYPIEEVKKLEDIKVGRDGLIMERDFHRGLLLPQVATEYGWDLDEFLNQTCRKAGMENYCWENGAKIYKFEAEVFNEQQ